MKHLIIALLLVGCNAKRETEPEILKASVGEMRCYKYLIYPDSNYLKGFETDTAWCENYYHLEVLGALQLKGDKSLIITDSLKAIKGLLQLIGDMNQKIDKAHVMIFDNDTTRLGFGDTTRLTSCTP